MAADFPYGILTTKGLLNMTIIQAIIKVMKDAGRPLSPKEAYQMIIDKKLYVFKAQYPQGIVAGQIRRHCIGLDFPTAETKKYFNLEFDGKFSPLAEPVRTSPRSRRKSVNSKQSEVLLKKQSALAITLKDIQNLQSKYRELLKDRIIKDLKSLSPESFEHFSKRLLDVYGFEDVKVTSLSNDGGIDGYGKLKVGLAFMRVAFQCKRWTKSNVGRPEIDRFRGAIQGEYEQGIFFTTAKFAKGAKNVSIKPSAVPVILVDGPGIVDFMIEKQFGVQQESLSIHSYALDTILETENDI